jgi:hypothetical protein
LLDCGTNPPDGAVVSYYFKDAPAGEVTLSILDSQGEEIRSFSSEAPDGEDAAGQDGAPREPRVKKRQGSNRFIWDMRHAPAHRVVGGPEERVPPMGPLAPPGSYEVRLTVDGESRTAPLEIRKDPRISATQEELDAQFELLIEVRDKLSETHDSINRIRNIKRQLDEWLRRSSEDTGAQLPAAVVDAAKALQEQLQPIEEELIQTRMTGRGDALKHAGKLNSLIGSVTAIVASGDGAPTQQAYDVFREFSAQADQQFERLQALLDGDVAKLNDAIRDSGAAAIDTSAAPPPGGAAAAR